MGTLKIPWSMWYENTHIDLTFPVEWEVHACEMQGGQDIGDIAIREALKNPIGAPPLRSLAETSKDVCILVDDLSRPTPATRILPLILKELIDGGIREDKIMIICAMGSHRPLTRRDLIQKLGLDILERFHVSNHYAHDNLKYFGKSSRGIPIWVNRSFANADLKIAAGMISPRKNYFGGGSKLLSIGAAGWKTIHDTHVTCDPNEFRAHLDEVANIVGLDFIVNPLLNQELGIMHIVCGDPHLAYKKGVECAKKLYLTHFPAEVDIAVCNAWPKDTEGTQATIAQVPLFTAEQRVLSNDGTLVITSACTEGIGSHTIFSPGSSALSPYRSSTQRSASGPGYRRILMSPNLNQYDAMEILGEDFTFCKSWSKVINILQSKYGTTAKVAVFPHATMQFGGRLG